MVDETHGGGHGHTPNTKRRAVTFDIGRSVQFLAITFSDKFKKRSRTRPEKGVRV